MTDHRPSSLTVLASNVGTLSDMFTREPNRADRFTIDACGVHADFSRQLISIELLDALLGHAADVGIGEKLDAMFQGRHINSTEDRAVLHVANRAEPGSSEAARAATEQMERAFALARSLRGGELRAPGGSRFDTVVNIGIGGSDLGPAMAARALRPHLDGPALRFVSNVDPADLDAALDGLDPATTLFVVSSKTFTTLETMHNASRARAWVESGSTDWSAHFVGVTANPAAAAEWGVRADRVLRFFEWVGGRFSVSSTIGFPLACGIGPEKFTDFLGGMRAMDDHVRSAPAAANLPLVHALVWWANSALHGYESVAVIPYSHDLARFPAFLQQLVMESNGKSVTSDGRSVSARTSPVVWGEPGTNGQHAFFQLLHQGTFIVPVDFIGVLRGASSDREGHDLLMANLIAQSEALAAGRTANALRDAGESEELIPHKVFSGNRPSSVLVLDDLTPRTFGALVALYEHSTAIQGWLMGVNSFDQWGVELGKSIAADVAAAIATGAGSPLSMTSPLLDWYRASR